jgi:hypothetical protein
VPAVVTIVAVVAPATTVVAIPASLAAEEQIADGK